jgi:hypothetical protein
MMWLMLLLAGLFAAGAVYNLTQANLADAAVGLLIAGVLGGTYRFCQHQVQDRADFLAWLHQHRETVRGGGAAYRDQRITPDTEVTQFHACLSFVVLTTRFPSRYLVVGQDRLLRAGLAYSLVTVMLGWWGLPWGPVYTVQALVRNLRGGQRQRVSELLSQVETVRRRPT